MNSIKAKNLIKVLFPLSLLTLSIFCNAYSYQDSFASHEVSFVENNSDYSLDNSSAQFIGREDHPADRLFDFYLLGIEEVNNLEESTDDSKENSSTAYAYFSAQVSEKLVVNNAPFSFSQGASCQSVKKYVLFHSFRIDC